MKSFENIGLPIRIWVRLSRQARYPLEKGLKRFPLELFSEFGTFTRCDLVLFNLFLRLNDVHGHLDNRKPGLAHRCDYVAVLLSEKRP